MTTKFTSCRRAYSGIFCWLNDTFLHEMWTLPQTLGVQKAVSSFSKFPTTISKNWEMILGYYPNLLFNAKFDALSTDNKNLKKCKTIFLLKHSKNVFIFMGLISWILFFRLFILIIELLVNFCVERYVSRYDCTIQKTIFLFKIRRINKNPGHFKTFLMQK